MTLLIFSILYLIVGFCLTIGFLVWDSGSDEFNIGQIGHVFTYPICMIILLWPLGLIVGIFVWIGEIFNK